VKIRQFSLCCANVHHDCATHLQHSNIFFSSIPGIVDFALTVVDESLLALSESKLFGGSFFEEIQIIAVL